MSDDRRRVHRHDDRPYGWVGAYSERRAALSPDAVGLRDATTGTALTYERLDGRANRTARLLRSAGVADGDRVAVVSRNRPELVDLFFAAGKTGGVLAPLSHRLAPPETAELLSTVDPELLVVERPFVGDVREALDDDAIGPEAEPTTVLTVDTGGIAGDRGPDPDHLGDGDGSEPADESAPLGEWYADALPAEDGPVEGAEVALSDPAMFLHTGGSTGVPKETVITHGGLLWNSFNTITAWGLRPDDVTPMTFPMFHTGGWNVLTVPLFHVGGEVAIAREFDPGEVLSLVERLGATVLVAVPAVLRAMADHDRWAETDLSTLRFAKSGGGPCRERVMETWWDRDVDLSQGYGLTECGPNNFAMPEGWDRERADSVGVPAPHVDTRVVDDDGRPVDPGGVGELELAGPHAGDRYWRNAEATRETFGDWVSTGDLARVDEDGYHYVEGRKKNMYVSGGENVYPAEVEDAITTHPDVAEAVVIPVPDDQWGQVGKAVLQMRAGRGSGDRGDTGDGGDGEAGDAGEDPLTLEELRSYLDGRLARFKHPRAIAFVEEVPTSGPSKIDREAVRERFGEDESEGRGGDD